MKSASLLPSQLERFAGEFGRCLHLQYTFVFADLS